MPARRQYAGPAAVKRAVQAALAALSEQGLELDVAGISFSPDGGVTVLTSKAAPERALRGQSGWDDFT